MQKSSLKDTILQWFVPIFILLATIMVIVINFTITTRDAITQLHNTNNKQVGKSYSDNIGSELATIASISDIMQSMVETRGGTNIVYLMDTVDAIVSSCDAYMAAYCWENGDAILPERVSSNLADTSYFELLQGRENFFAYTSDDGVTGAEAYMYICPVEWSGVVNGYLITYIDPAVLKSAFEEAHYGSRAYYAIVDEEGTILHTYGNISETTLLQSDFWNSLRPLANSAGHWKVFLGQRDSEEVASLEVTSGEEKRTIYSFPINQTTWNLVLFLDDSYVASSYNTIWQPVVTLVTTIIIAIVVFLIVIVTINILVRIKASEQNKGIIENLSGQIINYLKETEHIITKYKSHELLLENLYAMALLNAIAKFINNYSADNGILHISEFTKRLADVVFNESIPFIYERIGERYKHFLIDEFQDTSVLQWQILLPLFEHTLSTNEDAFTLVVGDAKQAIYRFRQGEVEQFVKLPDIYVPTENADMQTMLESRERVLKATGRIDNLAVNYRTAENIVRFNNTFFESLMQNDMVRDNKRVTDIYIGTNNTNERAAVIQDFSPRKKGGFVAIKFVNTVDDDARSKDDNVCEEIYQTIIDQVENKGYEYKDITVLARKKKELLKISSYLSSKNINVLSSESFLLMKNSEVLFLVSLLQVLNKPSDVVSILNVLDYLQKHSSHESEELYNSYFIGGTKNQSLFSFLKNNGYTLSFDEAELLSMTLYDCCETLIREFALYNDSKEFVTSFLNEVADYSTKNRQNLSEFLDYIAENSGKLSLKVSSTQNAVNLMTIHKSKGLKFPIVICPIFNSSKESGDKIWVELQEKEYMMPIGWVSYKEEMTTKLKNPIF